MLVSVFTFLCRVFPKLKGFLWKRWYQLLAGTYGVKGWTFMNYGYADMDNEADAVRLEKPDEDNRYCIQLYSHVARTIDLEDSEVLEVGSGRGGGADFVMRYLHPKKMTGVDFSENAIAFCRRNYSVDGLAFEMGNAESLPFDDKSFDVVVNVESSHCYGSMRDFLAQVFRVLRDDGYFLFTDLRSKGNMEKLQDELQSSGLALISETDITGNIVEALKLDDERKTEMIETMIHRPLVRSFLEFAGTNGSGVFEKFKNRETVYKSFVMQKPAGA